MKKFILCSILSLMLFSSFVLALTAEDILEQQEGMLEEQVMVEAGNYYLPIIPIVVDAKISDSWANGQA